MGIRRQKIKLSQAYNRLLQEQDTKKSKAIETAQKAWLPFRKVDCEAQALKGGSGAYNFLYHLLDSSNYGSHIGDGRIW